jgi:peptide/nickel transport system permease protein
VIDNFTGNWGTDIVPLAGIGLSGQPWAQVFAGYIPASVQLALFSLPIAAALAYPVSLLAGWSRRPWLDTPARFFTLLGALLPAFVIGILVYNALFFPYLHLFRDIPGLGLLPSVGWFDLRGGYPSWILYDSVTVPTGFPLIDALLHHAWAIAEICFIKTLIQASVVAVAYVAIFFRHARSVVRSVREEAHLVGARAWGIPERRLLWRYAARRVTPSFFLIFALTIPQFLGVLFAVEIAFIDQSGFGYLLFYDLGDLTVMDALIFLIALFVLLWTLVVDLIAIRLDPRGAVVR